MILLRPAYGRKYKSLEDAEKDWSDGKDFKIYQGPYCSIRDSELFKSMGHTVAMSVDNDLKVYKVIIKGN